MDIFQVVAVLVIAVTAFFAGRNYERHHPRTDAEAKAAAELSFAFRKLFKSKP